MRDFASLLDLVKRLRVAADRALAAERIPLVLGGEHTVSVAGIGAALALYGDSLGLLWIDAHADINTPGTSQSGNVHGMPIAALQGLPSGVEGLVNEEWNSLAAALGAVRLRPENTAWIGLRDVDLGERPFVKNGLGLTMTDIDRYGMAACVDRLDEQFRRVGARHLWVSFDVDALDPFLAPGTGTAVRGGLTYREAHLMAELLREKLDAGPYRLVGVDVVETNPMVDTSNETARMAVEWVLSLFGKTIL
jgi:arginase